MQDKTLEERERENIMTRGVDQDIAGQTMLPSVVENVLGSLGGKAFHNFTGDKMEIWRQVSIVTGPDVLPAAAILGKPFNLRNFYCHQVQIAGLSPGEYNDAIRCVLVDTAGNAYSFCSDGVAADLARLISTFGFGPYDKGIPIKVVEFMTNRRRKSYTIQPA